MSTRPTTRQVIVNHAAGLHARPCLAIVTTVRRYRSKVTLRSGDSEADAGDILQVMSLGVPQGSQVTLSAVGPDADDVLGALERLFADDFGFND